MKTLTSKLEANHNDITRELDRLIKQLKYWATTLGANQPSLSNNAEKQVQSQLSQTIQCQSFGLKKDFQTVSDFQKKYLERFRTLYPTVYKELFAPIEEIQNKRVKQCKHFEAKLSPIKENLNRGSSRRGGPIGRKEVERFIADLDKLRADWKKDGPRSWLADVHSHDLIQKLAKPHWAPLDNSVLVKLNAKQRLGLNLLILRSGLKVARVHSGARTSRNQFFWMIRNHLVVTHTDWMGPDNEKSSKMLDVYMGGVLATTAKRIAEAINGINVQRFPDIKQSDKKPGVDVYLPIKQWAGAKANSYLTPVFFNELKKLADKEINRKRLTYQQYQQELASAIDEETKRRLQRHPAPFESSHFSGNTIDLGFGVESKATPAFSKDLEWGKKMKIVHYYKGETTHYHIVFTP